VKGAHAVLGIVMARIQLLGLPVEVAAVYLFAPSDEACNVSVTVLVVTGGEPVLRASAAGRVGVRPS
jgi:hypothetical protein